MFGERTDALQQGIRAQIHFFVTEFALQNQRLNEYVEHSPSWVQRVCGILKYELDLRANLTANRLSTLGDVYPSNQMFPEVGDSRQARHAASVLLPDPDSRQLQTWFLGEL